MCVGADSPYVRGGRFTLCAWGRFTLCAWGQIHPMCVGADSPYVRWADSPSGAGSPDEAYRLLTTPWR